MPRSTTVWPASMDDDGGPEEPLNSQPSANGKPAGHWVETGTTKPAMQEQLGGGGGGDVTTDDVEFIDPGPTPKRGSLRTVEEEGGVEQAWRWGSSEKFTPPSVLSQQQGSAAASTQGKEKDEKDAMEKEKTKQVMGSDRNPRLLDPRSIFLKRWDINIGILLLFTAIVTPFEVSFIETEWTSPLFWMNRYLDVCFITDMAFQFRLPVQDEKGMWINYPQSIAIHYFKGWFMLDFVSVIPYDLVALIGGSDEAANLKVLRIIRLLRLAKLLRILRAGRMFQRWEATMTIDYAKISLMKFVVIILFLAHWMGCAWHLVAVLEVEVSADDENFERELRENTWVGFYFDAMGEEPGYGLWSRYVTCLYWSVATLSTLGYGDVVPSTAGERIFATMAAMLGATLYAYITGGVCSIVSGMDEHTTRFYAMMDALNAFMAEKHLPQELKVRLRDYFRFHRYNNPQHDWHSLLTVMSQALRAEVAQQLHKKWMDKVECFKGCGVEFVEAISMVLITDTYGTNESICRADEVSTQMFIVDKGVVAMSGAEGLEWMARIVVSGGTFGEEMMFRTSDMDRGYTAITLTNTMVMKLQRDDLVEILSRFAPERRTLRRYVVKHIFKKTMREYVKAMQKIRKVYPDTAHSDVEGFFPLLSSTVDLPTLYLTHMDLEQTKRSPEHLLQLTLAVTSVQKYVRRWKIKREKARAVAKEHLMDIGWEQLSQLLDNLQLTEYSELLHVHKVTFPMLSRLDYASLVSLGMKLGDVDVLMTGAQKFDPVNAPVRGAGPGGGAVLLKPRRSTVPAAGGHTDGVGKMAIPGIRSSIEKPTPMRRKSNPAASGNKLTRNYKK